MRLSLLIIHLVILNPFLFGQTKIEVSIKRTSFELVGTDTVNISSDDAEQENQTMDKLYDDDLDAGWEGDDFNTLVAGLRFTNVQIPQGAIIDSAYLEVYAHEEENDQAYITIIGQATDNAETFDLDNLITDRNQTNDSVLWTVNEKWTIWTKYKSADFAQVIQEIVNRSGWKSGNALAIFLKGSDQGASNEDNARDMESFENEEDPADGGDGKNHPERAPKLVVVYSGAASTSNIDISQNVEIIPNPANDFIQINIGKNQEFCISIVDLNGRKVYEKNVSSNEYINLSELPKGPYLIQGTLEMGSFRKKLLLK